MNKIDDGGPIIPGSGTSGMSLRDAFAMAALQGWAAAISTTTMINQDHRCSHPPTVAKACYDYADAMIAERKKGQ